MHDAQQSNAHLNHTSWTPFADFCSYTLSLIIIDEIGATKIAGWLYNSIKNEVETGDVHFPPPATTEMVVSRSKIWLRASLLDYIVSQIYCLAK